MNGSLLPSEEVTFVVSTFKEKNSIGEPVFEEREVSVKGCLVTPLTANEMVGPLALLEGVSYTIHIPKGVSTDNAYKVVLRGEEFFVRHTSGVLASSPLPWDRNVVVEAVKDV